MSTSEDLSTEKNLKPSKAKKHTKSNKTGAASKSNSKSRASVKGASGASAASKSKRASKVSSQKKTKPAKPTSSKRPSKASKKPADTKRASKVSKKPNSSANKNKSKSPASRASVKGSKGSKASKASKTSNKNDKTPKNKGGKGKKSKNSNKKDAPATSEDVPSAPSAPSAPDTSDAPDAPDASDDATAAPTEATEATQASEATNEATEPLAHKRTKTDAGYKGDDEFLDSVADMALSPSASELEPQEDSVGPPDPSDAPDAPDTAPDAAGASATNADEEKTDSTVPQAEDGAAAGAEAGVAKKGVGFAADLEAVGVGNIETGALVGQIEAEESGYESEIDYETEKRKKILRYRRHQSRYKLAKISEKDDMDTIAANNADIENENEESQPPPETPEKTPDPESTTETAEAKDDAKDDEEQDGSGAPTRRVRLGSVVMVDDDENSDDGIVLEKIELSQEQEKVLDSLELAFLEFDSDFYGFVPLTQFYKILKENELEVTDEEMKTKFEKTLMLIDDGVDYYGFLRHLREYGTEPDCEGKSLTEIIEYMSEMHDWEERTNNIDLTRMRTRSLANWKESQVKQVVLDENDPLTPLKRLMEDMALDDDEIDFASLKTALKSINCTPKDSDLEFLIDYLDTKGTGMIDFQYFFKFLHDAAINKKLWKNLTKMIESVAAQLRRAERAEKRRKDQNVKLKARLEQRKRARAKNDATDEEAAKLAEEKKKRALELRQKAQNYKG